MSNEIKKMPDHHTAAGHKHANSREKSGCFDGVHGETHLGGLIQNWLAVLKLGKLVLCIDADNALCDSRREFVWPLVNGLIGDAHGFGRR